MAKLNAAIVLTAQQPFATDLIIEARKQFRYEIIWEKDKPVGFLNANRMPLRAHENVLVFYRELPTYNPQKTFGHKPYTETSKTCTSNYSKHKRTPTINTDGSRYPRSVLKFNMDKPYILGHDSEGNTITHSTQKPVRLFANMIRTYTEPGETVLDNTSGIATTAVAAKLSGRRSICIEREPMYHEAGLRRVDPPQQEMNLTNL